MSTSKAEPATPACNVGLREAIDRLGMCRTAAERGPAAHALVEGARVHCGGAIELQMLVDAADALLAAVDPETGAGPDEALLTAADDFIDLARLKSVRRAAYPAQAGSDGGRWLDSIIRLIDKSNFTVGRMFRQRARQCGKRTLFKVPTGDVAVDYSWRQVSDHVRQIARGILAVLGDNPSVALYTPNRLEGALVDVACLTNGIFNTMVPANMVGSHVEQILVESGARMLVVSGTDPLQKAIAAFEDIPSLEWIVTLDALPTARAAHIMSLDALVEQGRSVSDELLEGRRKAVRSGDVATTMYTSGTTGAPKGIKFSHLNLVSKRYARAAALPEMDENEVFLCFLPLYHTFGRYLEMLACVHLGATYIFAESASTDTLIHHMQQFQPTAMISVPKKWIDLQRRAVPSDQPPDDLEEIRRTVAQLTGGRLRWGLSAAGRLDPAIFRFFRQNGIDLLSGYGMTEATGGITMTPPGAYKDDSIGKALPAIELGFDDDNELLLRGPYVSVGYTNAEDDATSFRDGWFCTGDIISRDAAGYLRHVDRKKDIYKNARGRTIAPQRVEALFADFPEVSSVFAVGDGREYVTLLIRPNVKNPEVDFDAMSDNTKREYFRSLVATCNRFLAPFERIVNFALIDRDFTMAKGELTLKGSFRRAVVEENFRDVIEPMYASSYTERIIDGIQVRIPVAFLQHLGATDSGICTDADGISFRAIGKTLRIRRDADVYDRIWLGNCCYDLPEGVIDLDDWLRLPSLWVGNAELTHITGENILLWSLSQDDRATVSQIVRLEPPNVAIDEWEARLKAFGESAISLLTVHAATVALFGGAEEIGLEAVDYLGRAMKTGRVRYQELAESHLRHAARHADRAIRSRAFVALLEQQSGRPFRKTAAMFCASLADFLDEDACARICRIGIIPDQWAALSRAFGSLRKTVAQACTSQACRFALSLLQALGKMAVMREDFHLPVRRELMAWGLARVPDEIRRVADRISEELRESLRARLGPKMDVATDPQTGREYTWDDTLQFEDGIDPDELDRVTQAMRRTELIREAVYLLHQQREIDLPDLAPDSIWVSITGSRFGRSVYHVGIRLRTRERCDFTLYVKTTAAAETFDTDLRLMCVGAGMPGWEPLTPQLGGFWPDYGIATVEHIAAESVEAMVRHMHDHPDKGVRQRLNHAWRHLSWSALTAAFGFYRRTEGQWMLSGTVTRDIAVPLNDFDERTRIFYAAGWRPFNGSLDMLLRLKHAFLDRVRFHYPTLTSETRDDVLFAAALEAFGLRDGLAFLKDAAASGRKPESANEDARRLCGEIDRFVVHVEENGYLPKAAFFAIARYHAWSKKVPDAGVHARAAQLRELQTSYRIQDVARKFPGSRLWLYAETVLRDSPEEGKATIRQAIRRLREGGEIKEVLGWLYDDLREKLPSHDQQYFLTRAAYPHLELDEKAELVTTSEVGAGRAELVTIHTDRIGREIRIRPVANSREADTLHRIFYVGGIGGGATRHEKQLIALDAAGYVVGGVGYIRRTPNHVLLDKIAVLPRSRGRGIGQILVQDFLRRQQAEGVTIVSAEFIRESWLSQFGFGSHPHHAGVVRTLREPLRPAGGVNDKP